MPLYIANPTRAGGDVQMPVWQWLEVVRTLSRTFPSGPELAGVIEDVLFAKKPTVGTDHVRITLTHPQIDQVRQVVS